jgi:hypothetical protein
MENKRKHLEFLQLAIIRMATNSFLLKGWSVTLAAALFALSARNAQPSFVIVAYLPVVVFWALDGYFLSQERLFRALYDDVRAREEDQVDYSMNTSAFKMAAGNNWWDAMWSAPTMYFYLPVIGAMLLVMAVIK